MSRLSTLRQRLAKEGLDALLVTDILNVRYLTNFTGSSATLYITEKEGFFITDFRYTEQAREEIPKEFEIIEEKDLKKALCQLVEKGMCVGFEEKTLSVGRLKTLKKGLSARFLPTKGLIDSMRMVKDEDEIAKIKEAIKIAHASFCKIRPLLREGTSEIEIAATLEFQIRMGGDGVGFPSIVASGRRSSLPHARSTHKRLKMGESVIIDCGAVYKGYNSDLTRTIFVGDGDEEMRYVYRVVLDALEVGLSIIRPGLLASELDIKVRRFIKDRGFGDHFGHNLGHGVGLGVHEDPEISSRNRSRLREGMVFTIEPGIYLPGKGGVRIEEMVLVKEGGCEVLSEEVSRNELHLPS